MVDDAVRLRLVFQDRRMLSKSQKSEGLKRIWILLSPHHETISDLASHLLHIFDLHDSCPDGLTLSMDGFVFPPFESTSLLKDKDIICVKRKRRTFSDIIKIFDGSESLDEDEPMEKQPLHTGIELLANEEFEKENDFQSKFQNDEFDDLTDTTPQNINLGVTKKSKKISAPKQVVHAGCNHIRNENAKQDNSEPEDGECTGLVESLLEDNVFISNGRSKKRKAPNEVKISKKKKKRCSVSKDIEDDGPTKKLESTHSLEKNIKSNSEVCAVFHEDATHNVDFSVLANGSEKLPSRSARRKKAKRKWLRELAKFEKEAVNQGKQSQPHEKDDHKISLECQQHDQKCESGDDVVPVVIRPGHIRFETIEKEQVVQPHEALVENFHWNGIISKKKGQKWGTQKFASYRSDDFDNFSEPECSNTTAIQELTTVTGPSSIDFDKLDLLLCAPKVGDVLAYRLLELSSSWTPELSCFRVGKTLCYNPECNKILLVPVAEYPIIAENLNDDGSPQPPDILLYNQDGSLEIDFASLVDVRIVKLSNPSLANSLSDSLALVVANDENTSPHKNTVSKTRSEASVAENGEVKGWEEIKQVLSAKKVELSREGNKSTDNSSKGLWSSRSVRGSALGPMLAHLRSKNDL